MRERVSVRGRWRGEGKGMERERGWRGEGKGMERRG